jgi:hypothetical protein
LITTFDTRSIIFKVESSSALFTVFETWLAHTSESYSLEDFNFSKWISRLKFGFFLELLFGWSVSSVTRVAGVSSKNSRFGGGLSFWILGVDIFDTLAHLVPSDSRETFSTLVNTFSLTVEWVDGKELVSTTLVTFLVILTFCAT